MRDVPSYPGEAQVSRQEEEDRRRQGGENHHPGDEMKGLIQGYPTTTGDDQSGGDGGEDGDRRVLG
jgi:hypothetical protein